VAQERDEWRAVVNTVMNSRGFIKCAEFLTSSSRRTVLHGVVYVSLLHTVPSPLFRFLSVLILSK
jgi:hypothetical protein